MGTWGPGIFSDDAAADLRDGAREVLASGLPDDEAIAKILSDFAEYFDDADDGPTMSIALALILHKVGRLTDAIRGRAIAAIDAGPDDRWDTPKLVAARVKALAAARATIDSPQPARKKISARWVDQTSLTPGTVLAFKTERGTTLLRVARISDSLGASPVVRTLAWTGTGVPSERELRRSKDLVITTVLFTGGRFPKPTVVPAGAIVYRDKKSEPDFEAAGFTIVGRMTLRAGDAELPEPGLYTWRRAAAAIESGEWFKPSQAKWHLGG